MAELNRGFKENAYLNIRVFSVENGYILETQTDRSMDSNVSIARSRNELNKLIEEIPDSLLEQLNKTEPPES